MLVGVESQKIKYINSKPNILSILLERYPDKNWNYHYLSENPYAIEYIKNHPEITWDWDCLKYNINIDIDSVFIYRNVNWDWKFLTTMPNMTMDIIAKYPQLPWHYNCISDNPSITCKDITKYPRIVWKYKSLSCNTNITEDFIRKNIDLEWDWYRLSKNPNLSKMFLNDDKFKKIYSDVVNINNINLSIDPNLTVGILEKYIDKNWDWDYISANNKNLTPEFIEKYKQYFNFTYLSQNPSVTVEIIENNLNEDWSLYNIFKNPNIPLEYSTKKSANNIDWKQVSSNSNITLDFIEKNLNNIDFNTLSGNVFLWDDIVYKKSLKDDIQKRKCQVNKEIKNIFYNDICGEILKFVSYD